MLDVVESYINRPVVSFNIRFQQYVCNIQDKQLMQEVSAAPKTLRSIDKIIDQLMKEAIL